MPNSNKSANQLNDGTTTPSPMVTVSEPEIANAKAPSVSKKRIRRTPEAAKALILETAARRLREEGLEGLNIKGVAEEAGMSHATLLHHFGNSDNMRRSLARHMTAKLLSDVAAALHAGDAPGELLGNLFSALSKDGHARLLAWLAVDNQNTFAIPDEDSQELFADIITIVAEGLNGDIATAKNVVMLVGSSAFGSSICGPALRTLIGLSDEECDRFPNWLGSAIPKLSED